MRDERCAVLRRSACPLPGFVLFVDHRQKTRRVYRELGLQLRNKTPKRRVKAKLREDRRNATRPNETWAMDFVHDQLATGRKLRVLTIVDAFSRFSPRWSRASPSAAAMSWKCWKESGER